MKLSGGIQQNWAAKSEGSAVASWWAVGLAVQDRNQAAGYKVKQNWRTQAVGHREIGQRLE